METPPRKSVRADARRNEDAILEAAKQLFTTSGIDATVREIATVAGVGMGTLYRRFPTRADLIASVFRREVDACAEAAATLSNDYGPGAAVALWLERYWDFLITKRGLAAALHSGDPAFDALPAYFRSQFEPALASLMQNAISAGDIRDDVDPWVLLRAVGALAGTADGGEPAEARVMLSVMIDGLHPGTQHCGPAADDGR